MESILEVKDLKKNYGDFAAVKGITFDIKEGEIFSLLGPNGAGKTTTISMLSTLYTPTSGDATIGGHSITKDPMAVTQVIGVVPQDLALYEDLTARENLIFWGQMYGLSGSPSTAAWMRCWSRSVWWTKPKTGQNLFGRHEAPRQHRRGSAPQAAPAVHG
jgi:ABC-type multidrug transport system ATPase subunit